MLQVCDVDVEAVKFSPFEELRLVSCGQESLRFWRVKENPHATAHIPGTNVVLHGLARNSHFTSFDFECERRV